MRRTAVSTGLVLIAWVAAASAQPAPSSSPEGASAKSGYLTPPKVIVDILDAPPPPSLPDWLPVRHYGGYHRNAAGPMPTLAAHRHPMIIADGGNWSFECPCGAV